MRTRYWRLLEQQLPGNQKKLCIIVQIRVASGGGWCLSVFIVLASAFSNWTVTQLHWDKFGFLQTGCTKQNTSNKNLNKIRFTFNHLKKPQQSYLPIFPSHNFLSHNKMVVLFLNTPCFFPVLLLEQMTDKGWRQERKLACYPYFHF